MSIINTFPMGMGSVTEKTTTNLSGILTGNGAHVGATDILPVSMGGTGASTAVEALRSLGARSNLNLLPNWDFRNPVNSPQQQSYTKSTSGTLYTIDGWYLNNATSNNSVVKAILTETGIIYSSTTSAYGFLGQKVRDVPVGTVLTASVSIGQNEGWIRLLDKNPDGTDAQAYNSPITSNGISKLTFTVKGGGEILFALRSRDGEEALFHAAKLELGEESTLALDLDQPSDFRAQALKLTGSTGGMDLSRVMTAAELHDQITAGDFSCIHTGDYWPITLNGSFKDYATGGAKTLSNAVVNLEFMPNFYSANYGDTAIGNHVLACSRDCLPIGFKLQSAQGEWFDESATNPFLGSHLYQTLNAADGIISLVEQTELGPYIGNMRYYWGNSPKGTAASTARIWGDRGKLFLPTETEVWGACNYGPNTSDIQWPIFAKFYNHIIKKVGTGGSGAVYWTSSTPSTNPNSGIVVQPNGTGGIYNSTSGPAVPICFIIK